MIAATFVVLFLTVGIALLQVFLVAEFLIIKNITQTQRGWRIQINYFIIFGVIVSILQSLIPVIVVVFYNEQLRLGVWDHLVSKMSFLDAINKCSFSLSMQIIKFIVVEFGKEYENHFLIFKVGVVIISLGILNLVLVGLAVYLQCKKGKLEQQE